MPMRARIGKVVNSEKMVVSGDGFTEGVKGFYEFAMFKSN